MIQPAERLNHAETYYFASKMAEIAAMNANGPAVINLGVGSPDLPPHPTVTEQLISSLNDKDAHQYQPYKGIIELKTAFAKWYQHHFQISLDLASQILPLIGSKEGIIHISFAFLSPGDKVLVPNPGYPSYSVAARLAGAEVIYFDLEEDLNWQPDFQKLEALDLTGVKLLWINYPNMPTGGNADQTFFNRLISFAKKHDILIVHDNPYTFILNPEEAHIFKSPEAIDHALELTSCSKNYNMAGWRVGAVAGKKEYLEMILKFKSNVDSGMFKPVQKAAAKALSLGKPWFEELNATYAQRKKEAQLIFDTLGCKYNKNGAGLFIWGKIPEGYNNAEELSEAILHGARVFITPGHIFGSKGNQYLRISLCGSITSFIEAQQRINNWLKQKI